MKWKDTLQDVDLTGRLNADLLEELRRSHIALNAKMDVMSRTIHEQVSRLVDRVIEISMVNQGGLSDAVKHRHVARLDDEGPEAKTDPWDEQSDDWPPPGHDAMNLP